MTNSATFDYPSPLAGYETAPPLPTERAEDGKSYRNPQTGILSSAYNKFIEPLDNGRRGAFDVHVYYFQNNPNQAKYARELWERIRREFPELRIYTLWDRPIGPHPVAMFEVNLFTPAQFGAFVPWLAIWRGPLSVLIHPNTTENMSEAERDLANHTTRAIWMGERIPLDVSLFTAHIPTLQHEILNVVASCTYLIIVYSILGNILPSVASVRTASASIRFEGLPRDVHGVHNYR